MKSEFLKVKRNIFFWIVLIGIISLGIMAVLSEIKIPDSLMTKPVIFNKINNVNYYYVIIINSSFSYFFILFFSLLTLVFYEVDHHLLKNAFAYNFRKSNLNILLNKALSVFFTCLFFYLVFCVLALSNLDLFQKNKIEQLYSFSLLFLLKYVINSFFLISILILVQAILKNMWLYLFFIIMNLSALFLVERQYSFFSWYVNALAFMLKFMKNRSFNITENYQSELFLAATFLILLLSFYYIEKIRYKQIRPQ